jgi:hypothetical protein
MPLSNKQIIKTWWPLAASWLLMGLESPAISAVIARLSNAEVNLAAYGGIVYPVSLIIEAPIIMLLAASTALSLDLPSYRKMYKFMMWTGFSMTVIHILVAFTPLYYVVVRNIIGSPEEIIEPARVGLMLMTPWTWSIGYRRFQQGVMIRYNHSQAVWYGTMVRLFSLGILLTVGYSVGSLPGVMVGASAQGFAVLAEAIFNGFYVQPVIRDYLIPAPLVKPLTWKAFFAFYIPLMLTSYLTLIWQPVGSAALSRMPKAVESLAVWQVLSGLLFILRSPGTALNEVVVAFMEKPGAYRALKKFAIYLIILSTAVYFIMAATPLATLWFEKLFELRPVLLELALIAFWIGIPLPLLTVLQSWFQGAIVFSKKTRSITESVTIFLVVIILVLMAGIFRSKTAGVYFGISALVAGTSAQVLWMYIRSRKIMKEAASRDITGETITS